jgi:hypothetical protein
VEAIRKVSTKNTEANFARSVDVRVETTTAVVSGQASHGWRLDKIGETTWVLGGYDLVAQDWAFDRVVNALKTQSRPTGYLEWMQVLKGHDLDMIRLRVTDIHSAPITTKTTRPVIAFI